MARFCTFSRAHQVNDPRSRRPPGRPRLGLLLFLLVAVCVPAVTAASPAFEVTPDGDGWLVRNVTPTDAPALGDVTFAASYPTPIRSAWSSATLWVDTQHQNAVAERVAISGDGTHAMAGWWLNNQRASLYAMTGSGTPNWSHSLPAAQFTISVDADNLGQHFITTAREEPLLVFDTASSTPLWTDSAYGDYVSSVSVTDDGSRLAAGSWGRLEGTLGPIVAIHDRMSSTPIFAVLDDEITDVGSYQCVDISEDGRRVVAGGKKVHARALGNGGYVLAIDVSDPVDVAGNAPGSVHPAVLSAAPNPFFQTTRIAVEGPAVAGDELRIVGAEGRLLRNIRVDGRGEVHWDGRDAHGRKLAPGVYYVRLRSESDRTRSASRSIVMVR